MIKKVWYAFYLCHRKFRPMTQKTLRGIALRQSGRVSLKRPAAGGESCLQDSFSYYKRKSLKNNIYHVTLKTFAPAKECRLRDLNPHGIATNGF